MALDPMAAPFVPFEGGETTATGSNNSSSIRISSGVGHQQQTTESTNVIGNDESNNNAILQQSSPPRNKSKLASADSSRSTINQRNSGDNNRQQGNNNRQLQLLLAPANNNANNKNESLSSSSVERRVVVSTDRRPLQQINNASNIGSVPSSSSSSSAVSTFGGGLSSFATLILNQLPFGSWGRSIAADSNSSDIQRNDDNNDNHTKYQSPLKRTGPLVCPPTPNKDLLSLQARLQHRSKPHAKRIKSASELGRGGSDTALVCNISFLCIVVWHFIICLTYLMLYFSFVGGRNTRCGETRWCLLWKGGVHAILI